MHDNEDVDWIRVNQERSSEHGYESLGSIEGGNVFGSLTGCWILKKESAPWINWLLIVVSHF
jgi:hypothetical protein